MSQAAIDANAVVSHEQDGRVLSGVGTTADELAEVMDRHTPEPAADPKAAEPVSAEPPQLKKGRERFSQLTAERDEAKKVAEAAETRAKELEAKLAAQPPSPAPAQVPAVPSVPAASASESEKPKLSTFTAKIGQDGGYANWEDANDAYNDARDAYRENALETKVRGTMEQDRAVRTFHEQAVQTIERGRKSYADFDAVKANGPGAKIDMDMDRVRAIVQHPQSEHLQYAIMKDGGIAQRVATCHPFEFGALLASLVPAQAAKAVVPVVAPPAPYTPVGSGSKTATVISSELAQGEDFDQSGYREKRAAERKSVRH